MVKTMAKLRMAHASTHGAGKPPGPTADVCQNEQTSIVLNVIAISKLSLNFLSYVWYFHRVICTVSL